MGRVGTPPNRPGIATRLSAGAGDLVSRLERIASNSPGAGRYRPLGEVGEGGMGRVLRVWDGDLERELAMKVVDLELEAGATDEERATHRRQLARFVEEARITGQLDHPGIVPVHEIGVDGEGLVYFTMPLVRGRTLKDVFELVRSQREGWSLHRAVGTVHKVCLTVAFAHTKGVIHRDLKPDNILVGPFGEAYVVDWGLALILGRVEHRAIIGTPAYMSPEQAAGRLEEVGPASDVYSLGAILYELVGKRVPHQVSLEEEPQTDMEELLASPPRRLGELAPDAPAEIVAICEKAMCARPEDRYPSVMAMAEDLRAWMEGRVVAVHRTGLLVEIKKWSQRNRGLARALQALVLLTLVSVLAFVIQQQTNIRQVRAERREALRSGYAANIRAADLGLRAHETSEAKRRLQACQPEFRGWEWNHLRLRSDSSERVFRGHSSEIGSVAVSPNGRLLATASDDRTVRLWDLESGAAAGELIGHEDVVTVVRFSPDGQRMATGSEDRTVRIWDLETGRVERELRGHGARVLALSFSPGSPGGRLASGDLDGTILLWDDDDTEPTELVASRDPVHSLAHNSVTGRLASGHSTGTVRTWNLATKRTVATELLRSGAVRSLAYHPGGEILSASVDRGLCFLDSASLETLRWLEGHEGTITCQGFDRGGTYLLSGSFDKTIRLWDVASGTPLAVFLGHDDEVNAVAFLRDGVGFVSGAEDGTARSWTTKRRAVRSLEDHTARVTTLSYREDGRRLVSGSQDHTLKIWDATSGELLSTIQAVDRVDCVTYGRGDQIAFGCDRPGVHVGPTAAGNEWKELGGHEHPRSMAYLRKLDRLFVRDWQGVRIWDGEGVAIGFVAEPDDQTGTLAVHPSGERFATGSENGEVRVWDTRTGKLLKTLATKSAPITALVYDPTGTSLAVGVDSSIEIHSAKTRELLRSLDGHESRVTSLAFSPDGTRLASGSIDNTVRVWDAAAGEALLTLHGHRQGVMAVAFNPDGRQIASASQDGTVRLWNTSAPAQR